VVASVASAGAGFPGPTRCFQCHDTTTNLIPFTDSVHAVLLAEPAGTYQPASLYTLLLNMYNHTAMDQELAAAGKIFADAYAQLKLPALDIGGLPTGYATECTNVVRYNYRILLPVDAAAAELGVPTAQMISAIKSSALTFQGTTLAATLGSLITVEFNGVPNGFARRDLWEASYPTLRHVLFPQLPVPH
jgi:hypothetical protein